MNPVWIQWNIQPVSGLLFELTPVMQQEDLGLFPTSTVATTRNVSIVNSGPAGRNLIAVVKSVTAHRNLFNIEDNIWAEVVTLPYLQHQCCLFPHQNCLCIKQRYSSCVCVCVCVCVFREGGEDGDSQGDGSSQPDTISIASRTSQNTVDSDKVGNTHSGRRSWLRLALWPVTSWWPTAVSELQGLLCSYNWQEQGLRVCSSGRRTVCFCAHYQVSV